MWWRKIDRSIFFSWYWNQVLHDFAVLVSQVYSSVAPLSWAASWENRYIVFRVYIFKQAFFFERVTRDRLFCMLLDRYAPLQSFVCVSICMCVRVCLCWCWCCLSWWWWWRWFPRLARRRSALAHKPQARARSDSEVKKNKKTKKQKRKDDKKKEKQEMTMVAVSTRWWCSREKRTTNDHFYPLTLHQPFSSSVCSVIFVHFSTHDGQRIEANSFFSGAREIETSHTHTTLNTIAKDKRHLAETGAPGYVSRGGKHANIDWLICTDGGQMEPVRIIRVLFLLLCVLCICWGPRYTANQRLL